MWAGRGRPDAATAPLHPYQQARAIMTRRTLLIVEPDEAIVHLFAEVLEDVGYAVARASGPRDAVRQLWACGRERLCLYCLCAT